MNSAGARIAAQIDSERFNDGDCVKIVFRPEDLAISKGDLQRADAHKIANGIVEEISFVGAYERLRIRIATSADECRVEDEAYYLTTQPPEREKSTSIIATRPKPEANAVRLSVRDRVSIALTSFTVLPSARKQTE